MGGREVLQGKLSLYTAVPIVCRKCRRNHNFILQILSLPTPQLPPLAFWVRGEMGHKNRGNISCCQGCTFHPEERQGLGQTLTLSHSRKRLELLSNRGSPRGRLIPPNVWRSLFQCLSIHPRAQRPFGLRKRGLENSAAMGQCLKPLKMRLFSPWAHPHSLHSNQDQTTDLGWGFQAGCTHLGTRSSDYFSFVIRKVPGPEISHSEPRELLIPLTTNLEIHFINSYSFPHLLKFRVWRWISFALKWNLPPELSH